MSEPFALRCDDIRGCVYLAELPHDIVGDALRREWRDALPPLATIDTLIAEFYRMPDNGCGGKLHIVLDDTNLDDDSIKFCIDIAEQEQDVNATALGRLLLALPMRTRVSLAHVCKCGCADEWLEDAQ